MVFAYILLLTFIANAWCSVIENAGCHSNYNVDHFNRSLDPGNDKFVSALLPNGKSLSIVHMFSSVKKCEFSYTLHYIICPSASSPLFACVVYDMCNLINEMDIGSNILDIALINNRLYIATDGLYLHGCYLKNDEIINCKTKYIKAGLSNARLALTTQVIVVYDVSPFLYMAVCDMNLYKCSSSKITDNNSGNPSPIIIKDKIHISASNSNDISIYSIYTCNSEFYCTLKTVPFRTCSIGTVITNIRSMYFADTYYTAPAPALTLTLQGKCLCPDAFTNGCSAYNNTCSDSKNNCLCTNSTDCSALYSPSCTITPTPVPYQQNCSPVSG